MTEHRGDRGEERVNKIADDTKTTAEDGINHIGERVYRIEHKFEKTIVTMKVDLKRLKTHGSMCFPGTGGSKVHHLDDGQTSFESYKIQFLNRRYKMWRKSNLLPVWKTRTR